jgi:hypothetical protein
MDLFLASERRNKVTLEAIDRMMKELNCPLTVDFETKHKKNADAYIKHMVKIRKLLQQTVASGLKEFNERQPSPYFEIETKLEAACSHLGNHYSAVIQGKFLSVFTAVMSADFKDMDEAAKQAEITSLATQASKGVEDIPDAASSGVETIGSPEAARTWAASRGKLMEFAQLLACAIHHLLGSAPLPVDDISRITSHICAVVDFSKEVCKVVSFTEIRACNMRWLCWLFWVTS